jgi:5'-methylthioadenosine phosphorylase
MKSSLPVVGVIGGSGLYEMEGLTDVDRRAIDTPWGAPSDEIVLGTLGEVRLAFLPRHGRGHRIPPHRIEFRANLFALKSVGAEWVISISAVGSMKEEIRPGDFVIVDQFVDRTIARPRTFFEDGIVAHVAFADPVCARLGDVVHDAARQAGIRVHRGGTYVCIDGPQFSTRAESNLFRSWGVSVVGMTNLPEARLAREAEICYATVALATDYDCWHEAEGDVTVDAVLAVLRRNVDNARRLIRLAAPRVPRPRACPCESALKNAILSDPAAVTPAARGRLDLLVRRYLP